MKNNRLIRGTAYAALFLLTYLLQTTLYLYTAEWITAVPNFMLSFTVFTGYLFGKRPGMMCGFLGGLSIDLFYGNVIGISAAVLAASGYFAGRLYQVYFENSIRMPLLLVFGSDLFYGFVMYITRFFLRGRINLGAYLSGVIIPEAVCTVLAAVPGYFLMYLIVRKWLRAKEGRRRSSWLKE